MTNKKTSTWQGNAAINAGVGIFRGTVGDSHFHTHWATQITIALHDEFVVETASASHVCQVAIIPAGTPHRLQQGHVVSIYIDPASNFTDALFLQPPARNGLAVLKKSDLHPTFLRISADSNLESILINIQQNTQRQTGADPRLAQLLMQLNDAVAEAEYTRKQLATSLGLSPSRFSHWFKEQTGIPLRSYKKWLKLRIAIEALLRGVPAADAALIGGFNDQAHFSNSFSAAFGITVSTASQAFTPH